MPGDPEILFWRRTDVTGLERLVLSISADTVLAESTVICVEDGGFRLDHRWRLTADWQAQSLDVERWGAAGRAQLSLERTVGGWCVNGQRRADLDGAEEPDLSVTLFATPSRSAGRLPAQERVTRSTPASWTGRL